MKHNYLIECTDFLTIQIEINKIIKNNKFEDASINYYDIQEVPLENALEDLDTYGFLTSKKVIVITNFESIDLSNEKDLDRLTKYSKNPSSDNILIITTKKYVIKDNKYLKELKKNLEIITISVDPISYIKNELKGYKVDRDVINLINEYCLEDITKIHNECNKLKLYKEEDKTISKEDVKELVIKKLGDATELTFSFTRALAERNKKEALNLYQEILDYNVEPLSLIGLLASQFRIMYQVKVLDRKRMNNAEIAKILNTKEYRIMKTKELTRFYTEKEILNLIIKLSEIDLKIKTTSNDPNLLIQVFILNI